MKLANFISSAVVALAAAVALVSLSGDHATAAGTSTTGMNVDAAVDVRCTIGAGALSFGSTYVSGQPDPIDSTTIVVVACDPGRKVAIKLGQGLNPAPGSTDNNPLRRLRNGTHYLTYQLYEDAARTEVWDNRSNAVRTTRVFPYTATVYARLPGLQAAFPGTYSDRVVATVHF